VVEKIHHRCKQNVLIVVLTPTTKGYFYSPFKRLGPWKADFKRLLKMDEPEHK
jgi:hypothetical protein